MSRPYAPACDRNREPILTIIRDLLPATGRVLELGSGSGQHAAYFSAALPLLEWLPSDLPECLPVSKLGVMMRERTVLNPLR